MSLSITAGNGASTPLINPKQYGFFPDYSVSVKNYLNTFSNFKGL